MGTLSLVRVDIIPSRVSLFVLPLNLSAKSIFVSDLKKVRLGIVKCVFFLF